MKDFFKNVFATFVGLFLFVLVTLLRLYLRYGVVERKYD